jgi:stage II sporulation protein D
MILYAVGLTLFAMLLSVTAGAFAARTDADTSPAPSEQPAASPSVTPPLGLLDSATTLRFLDRDGTIRDITMAEYLVGVVAAECPAGFETNALSAQAVAARTYTLRQMRIEPRTEHPDADVCGDFTHCQAFVSESDMRANWGARYDEYLAKIRAAVAATDGVYLTYASQPILAVFHSSSNGWTEDAAAVWGGAFPYLVSVPTPDADEDIPNFTTTVSVTLDDFKAAILSRHADADLTGASETWVGASTFDASGRVASVMIGGVAMSGLELRELFELRSTSLTVEVGDDVTITAAGYGHGVGMSQYGANALAKHGFTWREILETYYTGAGFSDEVQSA